MDPTPRLANIIRRLLADMQETSPPDTERGATRAILCEAAQCLDWRREADTAGCAVYLDRACVRLQGHTEHAQACRLHIACQTLILAEKAVDLAKPWPVLAGPLR